ncbi:hypothetical protein QUF50_01520 [Thiotrichales bacterium HSG1]|nr:hypothetical protein [Thiotrichales bacterium HSG1]
MDKESQNVVITDVKIPFMSMVGFIIKTTLAAIPAIIILGAIMVGLSFGINILIEMFDLQEMFSFMQQ